VPGRIVLFGATGYTGELTARAMVKRGLTPVLAGRRSYEVRRLARELGQLEHAIADVSNPASVQALVERGDVLVSTVGPFGRWGAPAVEAAIEAGAHYLDSTGESAFIRRVFEDWGPRAQRAGSALLTSFGADWVPGNLAGGLALREAGAPARRLLIGYYMVGSGGVSASGGTRASAVGTVLEPSFAFRGGRIVTERPMVRRHNFEVRGRRRPAISIAGSEHFALPRMHPELRDVDEYLGWFGAFTAPLQATAMCVRLPGVRQTVTAISGRFMRGSTGGPSAEQRARSGQHIVAIAENGSGEALSHVHLEGPNAYTYTADILAWGAERVQGGGAQGSGALGPVDAFGLDALREGCAAAGLVRV
jgi:short subunit dehydrogenase-like uncharacterized protein